MAVPPARAAAFITKWGVPDRVADGIWAGPVGVATDSSGNVYVSVADELIEKYSSTGDFITRWGGEGTAPGKFNGPNGVATDSSGNVYVADGDNYRIQKFSPTGAFIRQWGTYGAAQGQFKYPDGVATDSAGNVYVADPVNHNVQKFSSTGQFITTWGRLGTGDGEFYYGSPSFLAVDPSGNVYVTDFHRIQKFNSTGQFVTKWGRAGTGDGEFGAPTGVAVDRFGNVYVAERAYSSNEPDRIQMFSSTGAFIAKWGEDGAESEGGFWNPVGVAADRSGNVYIADYFNERIQKFVARLAPFATLAREFEPVLRFDSSERQRPLNVDAFLAEGQHQICDAGSCSPIRTEADLGLHNTPSSYLNIAGSFGLDGDAGSYGSPITGCTTNFADCDTGVRSAIYYRVAGAWYPSSGSTGYTYLDYWIFYRVNDFDSRTDQHEGDWEAVSVAPAGGNTTNPSTFDYAAMSQHGTFAAYLRDNLTCQDSPSGTIPPRGTCGTESAKTGKRLALMVAHGSHANYPKPCSETGHLDCRSSFSFGGLERGYDGTVLWGRGGENDGTRLLPLPAGTGGPGFNWESWRGKWGNAEDGWRDPATGSMPGPLSPVYQAGRIRCASIDNDRGCADIGPRVAGNGRPQGGAVYRSPGLAATSCRSWLGAGVTAALCDPKALRAAVLGGRVGHRGEDRLMVSGSNRRSAAGRGIAQYAGAPLIPGKSVRILGRVPQRAKLLLRIRDKRRARLMSAQYRLSGIRGSRAGSARRPVVSLRLRLRTEEGIRTPVLGGRAPVRLKIERSRRLHRP